jgi:hypothetical protein
MKIAELMTGEYIGDIIGATPMGKKLAKKQDKKEKQKTTKIVAKAGSLVEQLGQLYAEFHALIKRSDVNDDDIKQVLRKIDAEAKARGQTSHDMVDDMMSPLSVEELKKVMRLGTAQLKTAAREEFSHRNQ